jgi:hypothetical protein
MQVVLLLCLVSCDRFKLGSRGFLVRSWAMRWAKIYLGTSYRLYWILAKSNRFIKLPRVALSFTLCLNSCNTLLPNLDWFGSALSHVVILTSYFYIPLQKGTWITCFPNSRNRTNLGCYMLRVQSCQSLCKSWQNQVSCGRCRFLGCFKANHPMD